MDLSVIKKRIQKLLALSASDNKAEADLAMQKCRELMDKYDIRTIDIDEETRTADVEIHMVDGYTKKHRHWESKLAKSIAEAFDGDAFKMKHANKWQVVFVAGKSDYEFIIYLYKRLRRIISKQAKEYAEKHEGNKKSLKHNYSLGMGNTIHTRLITLYKSLPDTRALVVIKKDAINKLIEEELGKPTASSSNTAVSDKAAFMRGQVDGNSVALTKVLRN